MVGPQFQADLSNLHLSRHGEKSKWGPGGGRAKTKTLLQPGRKSLHVRPERVPRPQREPEGTSPVTCSPCTTTCRTAKAGPEEAGDSAPWPGPRTCPLGTCCSPLSPQVSALPCPCLVPEPSQYPILDLICLSITLQSVVASLVLRQELSPHL